MVSVENRVPSCELSAAIEPFATPPKLPAPAFRTFSISVLEITVNIHSVGCIKKNVMKRVATGEIVLNVNSIMDILKGLLGMEPVVTILRVDWLNPPKFEPTHCSQCGELIKFNISGFIVQADGTAICQKHQQISPSMAKKLLSSGNWKVDSFGIS